MRKLMFVVLAVFGLVSVSMGAWIPEEDEANYQKLKAEMEEYGGGEGCKWSEDGKKLISSGNVSGHLCKFQKVLLFFDEIRASKVQADCGKSAYKQFCSKEDREFGIAMKKVREMPLFKNDSGIYSFVKTNRGSMKEMAYFNDKAFWESVFDEWERTKSDLEIDGARRGYWKKMAE